MLDIALDAQRKNIKNLVFLGGLVSPWLDNDA